MEIVNPTPRTMAAGLRATLSAAVLMGVAASANAETVSDLLAPSMAGKVFFVSDAPGYFTNVPAIGEVWQVTPGGELQERGAVLHHGEDVQISWQTSPRMVLGLNQELSFQSTDQDAALAVYIAEALQNPHRFALPSGPALLGLLPDFSVVDAEGVTLGSWEPVSEALVLRLSDEAPILVSLSELAAAVETEVRQP